MNFKTVPIFVAMMCFGGSVVAADLTTVVDLSHRTLLELQKICDESATSILVDRDEELSFECHSWSEGGEAQPLLENFSTEMHSGGGGVGG